MKGGPASGPPPLSGTHRGLGLQRPRVPAREKGAQRGFLSQLSVGDEAGRHLPPHRRFCRGRTSAWRCPARGVEGLADRGPEGGRPMTGAELLDQVISYLRRYVVFVSDSQPLALALWVIHTHAIEAADTTPYPLITSPEKRPGRRGLLEALEVLVGAGGSWPVYRRRSCSARSRRSCRRSCSTSSTRSSAPTARRRSRSGPSSTPETAAAAPSPGASATITTSRTSTSIVRRPGGHRYRPAAGDDPRPCDRDRPAAKRTSRSSGSATAGRGRRRR